MNIMVIGTGSIASIIASDIDNSHHIIVGVVSRTLSKAEKFIKINGLDNAKGFDSINECFNLTKPDLIYLAVPAEARYYYLNTVAKLECKLLLEKPFINTADVIAISNSLNDSKSQYYEASHFTYTERHKHILNGISNVGDVYQVSGNFHFPFTDSSAVKFNPKLEPMGSLGDLGWYPVRNLVYLLGDPGEPISAMGTLRIDKSTGSIVGGYGIIEYKGFTFNISFGYDLPAVNQQFSIVGSDSELIIEDTIIPYSNSFIYKSEQPLQYKFSQGIEPYKENNTHQFLPKEPPHKQMFDFIENDHNGTDFNQVIATMKILDYISNNFFRREVCFLNQ